MGEKTIVLALSGGMDSATLLGYYLSNNYNIIPVSFNYGSKHNKYENICVQKLLNYYKIETCININLDFIKDIFKSNLLQSGGDIPEGHYEDDNMKLTVVPGRNLIFASILAGIAESNNAEIIALGIHSGDHAIYPDCREEFFTSLKKTIQLSSDNKIDVQAPFINLYKKNILEIGYNLDPLFKIPYEYTRTCYENQELSCGKCIDENTYITMNDFTQKKIKNIKINDVILGITKINSIKQTVPSTVLNFYNQGIKDTITIENELSNQLTLTPDHECLTITSKSNTTKYRPIEKILISKYPYLFCYDYTIKDKDFYEGWIAGYLSHNAQFNYQLEQKTNNKYLNIKCLCQDIIEEKEVRQILYEQGYNTFDGKHHTNDGEFRCFKIFKQNQTKYIQHLISNEYNISKNFKLGWITGAIDADGYYDKNNIRYFKSDSRYNLFLKFIKFLDDLNISHNIQTTKRKTVVINNRKINGAPNNIVIISKRNAFKLPTNLSKRINQFKNITIQRSKSIVKLISKQKSNVIDITTTTGNFIANGMIIHNCGSCQERLEAFKQIGKVDPIEYH